MGNVVVDLSMSLDGFAAAAGKAPRAVDLTDSCSSS